MDLPCPPVVPFRPPWIPSQGRPWAARDTGPQQLLGARKNQPDLSWTIQFILNRPPPSIRFATKALSPVRFRINRPGFGTHFSSPRPSWFILNQIYPEPDLSWPDLHWPAFSSGRPLASSGCEQDMRLARCTSMHPYGRPTYRHDGSFHEVVEKSRKTHRPGRKHKCSPASERSRLKNKLIIKQFILNCPIPKPRL